MFISDLHNYIAHSSTYKIYAAVDSKFFEPKDHEGYLCYL